MLEIAFVCKWHLYVVQQAILLMHGIEILVIITFYAQNFGYNHSGMGRIYTCEEVQILWAVMNCIALDFLYFINNKLFIT